MSNQVSIGSRHVKVINETPIDNVTPYVIPVNHSRSVLAIANQSATDNLIVTIVDRGGVTTASFLLLPGHLYEPQVCYANEIRLIAELNPVGATILEG